jgi:elongation factor Ts
VITSENVQKLRAQTGAGMMDCKRALESSGGDMDKAVKTLREQGAATAAKRAGRVTGDGLVAAHVEPSGKTVVLLELNCETDFVARTDDFLRLIGDLAKKAAQSAPGWTSPADAPTKEVQDAVAKLGENISLRRFTRYDAAGPSVYGVYIHPSGSTGKVGVIVEVGAADAKFLAGDEAKSLARDLAMQVAATAPRWVRREDVPADVLEGEKAIAVEQAKRDNKPEKIWDKIAQGKTTQFCQQFCLLEQPFVKDPGGKTPVSELVKQVSAKAGGELTVKRFVRYKVAEEA